MELMAYSLLIEGQCGGEALCCSLGLEVITPPYFAVAHCVDWETSYSREPSMIWLGLSRTQMCSVSKKPIAEWQEVEGESFPKEAGY